MEKISVSLVVASIKKTTKRAKWKEKSLFLWWRRIEI